MIDNDGRLLYNTTEVMRMLGIGRTLMYKLLTRPDFPKIMINGRYYIPKEKLTKWCGKG